MKATILAAIALVFLGNQAYAVSLAVKLACRDDYFAHCSMHAVGSPGVRKCMRDVGPRLSQGCISALADAGEIKKAKIATNKSSTKKYAAANPVAKKYAAKKQYAKKQYAQKRAAKKYAASKTYEKKRYVQKRNDRGYAEKKQYAKTRIAYRG